MNGLAWRPFRQHQNETEHAAPQQERGDRHRAWWSPGLATVLFVEQCAASSVWRREKGATTTVAMVLSTVTDISSSPDAVAP